MKYKIDVVRVRENRITVNGWVVGKTPEAEVRFQVLDADGRELPATVVSTRRDDVSRIYFHTVTEKELGFDITFDYVRGKTYSLCIFCEGKMARIKFNEDLIAKRSSVAHKRAEKIRDLCNWETMRVVWDNLQKHGVRAVYRKAKNKIKGIDSDYEYPEWYGKIKPSEEELEAQRSRTWTNPIKFSVVIPVYETPEIFLRELLDSWQAQTYENFEVCIADGSRPGNSREEILKEYAKTDPRIRYEILGENRGIADNTNAALAMAAGDFVVLCDHDDLVPPEALYACARALEEDPTIDCIYSDEDKLDMDGGALFDPHFKPDFNIDLLCSVNYICHLFVFRRSLTETCGVFDPAFDGAQDYDFIFRITEASRTIRHIPQILYHWRCSAASTASNPESKLYAFEAGGRAIKAHYARIHPELTVERVEKGADYGIYHTCFGVKDPEPLISVIIPNKDHTEDLDTAIRAVLKGNYHRLEFIVVENNSTLEKTRTYYEKIQKELPCVRVVTYPEQGFNFSKINNFGVTFAGGDYLLFMNNDVEMVEPDSIKEMLGYVQREDVGIAGCKLLYEDDSIQHAGVVVGFGGIAGHTFIGLYDYQKSYFHRAQTAQDYSAVTAACLMTKKAVFEAAGGFSPELAVAFNDIDYCMKVRQLGKLVVYNPYSVWHHYESKSRGLEDTPEKVDRFNREVAVFMKKWPEILAKGDPYYNPNLTLRKSDFSLRDLLKEKIGEPYHLEGIEKYL